MLSLRWLGSVIFVSSPAVNIQHNGLPTVAEQMICVCVVINTPTALHESSPLAYIMYYSAPLALLPRPRYALCRVGYLGYLCYSGRPLTAPFLRDSLQLLGTVISINGSEVGQSHPILRYYELGATQ